MFDTLKQSSRRSTFSLLASFLLHCLLLFLWLDRTPIFVKPSFVAWGQHGQSDTLIYFPRTTGPKPSSKLQFQARAHLKSSKKAPENIIESARSGAPNGSLFRGPGVGVEARPLYP
jgi:hypothetical protein